MADVALWNAGEIFTTTGTGTITLAGAMTGMARFGSGAGGEMTDGDTGLFGAEEFDPTTKEPTGAWQIFRGTIGATGTTLTIDSVVRSSTGSAISWAAGTKRVWGLQPTGARIEVFDASGSYIKPLWLSVAQVFVWAAGAGGASGRKGAPGSLRTGGGGGGGGGFSSAWFPADLLAASETITVGVGGAGGTSRTVDSTDGVPGGVGGATLFGSLLRASGAFSGSGGTSTAAASGGTAGPGEYGGGTGSGSSAIGGIGSGGSRSTKACGGGGGGGGVTTANGANSGGAGAGDALVWSGQQGFGGGPAGGSTGLPTGSTASPATRETNNWRGGQGGGGGAGSITADAGTGGNGQAPGGGGGGGGAATNGIGDSGAGGRGADGRCVVISF